MAVPPYLLSLANAVPNFAAQSWTPRVSGGVNAPVDATGGQGNSLRNFLADIYGYNTQANIANLQGQYGLEGQRLQNAGGIDIANIREAGANTRNVNDNAGADFRAQLGAQAATYAPQLQQDRFQQVWNGAAAPLLQTLFGVTPGDPFQARQQPSFGGAAPSYSQGAPVQTSSPQPVTQGQPMAQGGGRPQMTTTRLPGGGTASGMTRPQQPRPMQRPTPVQAPVPQPQQRPAPRVAQATSTGQAEVFKPLPGQFAGPKITTGDVYSDSQMQSMVNRQQGRNAARQAASDRADERRMAGAGFGGNSPQTQALRNQNAIARSFMDQEAATTIPVQYAQANASQRLASEQANANVFAQRRQEELARRGQGANMQTNFMNMILGMA